ncbi:MAG: hypothetical protein IID15_01525 [Candidatus Marinimicrobia bacterium]|nr:hypothetical protein [Candidatus Neomarinimicrobiota bacterium]
MDLAARMISAVTVRLLVLSADIYGQTGTISGFVRDSTNSETLSYVNVFVQGTNYGAATDRAGNGKEFSGTVNISLISAKGLVEGPLPQMGPVKGTYMLSVRRTYLDKMMEGAFWALGLSDNPEFIALPYHFWDLQAKADFDVGEKHRFTVSTFSGLDQLLFQARLELGQPGQLYRLALDTDAQTDFARLCCQEPLQVRH